MNNYLKYDSFVDGVYIHSKSIGDDTLQVKLSAKFCRDADCKFPDENTPIVGVLPELRSDHYYADMKLVREIIRAGMNVVFLPHSFSSEQLNGCCGLIVPDGSFLIPDNFYADNHKAKNLLHSDNFAYVQCVARAMERNLPILAINKGGLLVAGLCGLQICRSINEFVTPLHHYRTDDGGHLVNIKNDTPLFEALGRRESVRVNSRHTNVLASVRRQREHLSEVMGIPEQDVKLPLDIYAEANDGVPEAWGLADKKILCVQWNPELMSAEGGIFDYFSKQLSL